MFLPQQAKGIGKAPQVITYLDDKSKILSFQQNVIPQKPFL